MSRRAAIAGHPIHPALVALPIGCFSLVLGGDVAHAATGLDAWYRFSFVCLGIGIVTAFAAAAGGLVDYFGVRMSALGRTLAKTHFTLNVTCVLLYGLDWLLRRGAGALHTGRWSLAFGLEVLAFLGLGVSAWLGGSIVFESRLGALEGKEPEGAAIDRG